jgi:hypothetical protein
VFEWTVEQEKMYQEIEDLYAEHNPEQQKNKVNGEEEEGEKDQPE